MIEFVCSKTGITASMSNRFFCIGVIHSNVLSSSTSSSNVSSCSGC